MAKPIFCQRATAGWFVLTTMLNCMARKPALRASSRECSQRARPIPRPERNIFCIGKNYFEHAHEFARSGFDSSAANGAVPKHPIIFSKVPETVVANGAAIVIDPSHANARNNLGVLLRATGQSIEAEAAYREAIRLNPEHIDAYTNLGNLLNGLKRTEEAAACFCKVITLTPKHPEARKLLALAYCMLGEINEATKILEEWLEEEPGNPIARHMLAACTGRDVPERASDGFVEATFDSFAASFEVKLASLSYRAPALVAAMLEDCGLQPSHRLDVLDAGCGTGLCGALVEPFARRMVGVDLSDGMLTHAKEKNVYHALVKAELSEYLGDNREAFDLIVSADTLVYFGDLKGIIAAFAGALRPNGLFVFTLEHAVGDSANVEYRLEVHGRYSHARAYVERLLTFSGFQAKIIQAELRMEAGVPVPGLVIRAVKSDSVHFASPAHGKTSADDRTTFQSKGFPGISIYDQRPGRTWH